MRRSSTSLRVKVIVLAMLALSGLATSKRSNSADELLARKTVPGIAVWVRGFAEVDADCKAKHIQTIRVIAAPSHGRIEQRTGIVTIDDHGIGNQACRGTKANGVQVFYVPEDAYVGTDRFTFDVEDFNHRTRRAMVDMTVSVGARSASN